MKKILILLFFVVSLQVYSQNQIQVGFNLVQVVDDSSDCLIIWYAHSGKDVKTIIKKDTQEIIRDDNQMYYIERKDEEYYLIQLL